MAVLFLKIPACDLRPDQKLRLPGFYQNAVLFCNYQQHAVAADKS